MFRPTEIVLGFPTSTVELSKDCLEFSLYTDILLGSLQEKSLILS